MRHCFKFMYSTIIYVHFGGSMIQWKQYSSIQFPMFYLINSKSDSSKMSYCDWVKYTQWYGINFRKFDSFVKPSFRHLSYEFALNWLVFSYKSQNPIWVIIFCLVYLQETPNMCSSSSSEVHGVRCSDLVQVIFTWSEVFPHLEWERVERSLIYYNKIEIPGFLVV